MFGYVQLNRFYSALDLSKSKKPFRFQLSHSKVFIRYSNLHSYSIFFSINKVSTYSSVSLDLHCYPVPSYWDPRDTVLETRIRAIPDCTRRKPSLKATYSNELQLDLLLAH